MRDLAHIKALRKRAEAGDPEALERFWELAREMEVKLAIRRGMVGEGEPRSDGGPSNSDSGDDQPWLLE